MVKQGCLYISSYVKNKRSDTSYAQLEDNSFIRISQFLVDKENNIEQTLCKKVDASEVTGCEAMYKITNICTDEKLEDTSKIARICVMTTTDKIRHITPVPYPYFY